MAKKKAKKFAQKRAHQAYVKAQAQGKFRPKNIPPKRGKGAPYKRQPKHRNRGGC